MDRSRADEVNRQQEYYRQTAQQYDELHGGQHHPQHAVALAFLTGALDWLGAASLLDVGAGTGRVLRHLRRHRPELKLVGIEPVAALRQAGHEAGLAPTELIEGDGAALAFADGAFDVVSAFGMLHHVRHPEQVVAEMLRVARRAIFISDANYLGQGLAPVRWLKRCLTAAGLWRVADHLKTRGRGYSVSEGDGLSYSYSIFQDLPLIRRTCRNVYLLNTGSDRPNLYADAPSVALLAVK
ncbi:MAG: class I SAM-dependent methyltransferase [Armatimonadetes bacterium]|nr:class I SAM-dependent methyltransferase [Armatimonadota bacterium]